MGLLAASCNFPTATPVATPTARPTLNISLWVDFPLVSAGYPQAANVVVSDQTGQPVAGAEVRGIYHTPDREEIVFFPTTDATGRTRIPLDLPSISTSQTFTLTVYIVENGEWGQSVTSFEVRP